MISHPKRLAIARPTKSVLCFCGFLLICLGYSSLCRAEMDSDSCKSSNPSGVLNGELTEQSQAIATKISGEPPAGQNDLFAYSKETFCRYAQDLDYFKRLTNRFTAKLSFTNPRGPLGLGLCWWMTRFHRNALYTTYSRPDLPKPTKEQALKIIEEIIENKSVVEIPGYSSFGVFSSEWKDEIERKLGYWQIRDTLAFQWVKAIGASSSMNPKKLEKHMDDLYAKMQSSGGVQYALLKSDQVGAHAWLIVDMRRTPSGYELDVFDSNYRRKVLVDYRRGARSLVPPKELQFKEAIPYLQRDDELASSLASILLFCKPGDARQIVLNKAKFHLDHDRFVGKDGISRKLGLKEDIQSVTNGGAIPERLRPYLYSDEGLSPEKWTGLMRNSP